MHRYIFHRVVQSVKTDKNHYHELNEMLPICKSKIEYHKFITKLFTAFDQC